MSDGLTFLGLVINYLTLATILILVIFLLIFIYKIKIDKKLGYFSKRPHSILLIGFLILVVIEFFNEFSPKNSVNEENFILLAFIGLVSLYIIEYDYEKENDLDKNLQRKKFLEKNIELVDLFNGISEGGKNGIVDYRNYIFKKFKDNLYELYHTQQTKSLTVEDSDNWVAEKLKDIKEGDSIRAIALLKTPDGKQPDIVSSWSWYLGANNDAAKECKDVRRIFLTDEDTLRNCFNKTEDYVEDFREFLAAHKPPQYNGKKVIKSEDLIGIFVNKEEFEKRHIELGKNDGLQGFLLLNNSGVKMAVIDKFNDSSLNINKYRSVITYNEEKIKEFEHQIEIIEKEAIAYYNSKMREDSKNLIFKIEDFKNNTYNEVR